MAPRRIANRKAASWILLGFQCIFALIYCFPSLVYRAGAPSGTSSVVAFINNDFPLIWVGAFGITGLGLTCAMYFNKGIHVWHLFASAVFGGYAAALFFGAFTTSPHGSVTYPLLALLPMIGNFLLALSYGGDR